MAQELEPHLKVAIDERIARGTDEVQSRVAVLRGPGNEPGDLAGIYARITLLLVAIGFYGVMSSRAARRRNESGIRLALGASRGNIQLLIVGQTARILLAGILPGAALSVLAVRTSGHFLYGSVSAIFFAIVAASLVLAFAGAVATILPARRAAFADPLETLRSE
jgi:ABC-type antimicrobial peptide transport system permease subunit